jgi:hypothetical protein
MSEKLSELKEPRYRSVNCLSLYNKTNALAFIPGLGKKRSKSGSKRRCPNFRAFHTRQCLKRQRILELKQKMDHSLRDCIDKAMCLRQFIKEQYCDILCRRWAMDLRDEIGSKIVPMKVISWEAKGPFSLDHVIEIVRVTSSK